MAHTERQDTVGNEDVDGPEFAARIQRRDPAAVETVVRLYLPQVLRAARAAGLGTDLAQDVTQSTFGTFIEAGPRFEGRSHVRTWLFGILYRKIAEARRGVRRRRMVDSIDDVSDQRFDADGSWTKPPRAVDAELYASEVRGEIERCLDAVPDRQRMAFVLREIEQFDTKEICKILDVTPTNLGVLLHRVRNRLRECLEARGMRG